MHDTPERYQRMLEYIRAGSYLHVAAQAVGVAPETLSRWLSRGRSARSGTSYYQFRQDVTQAIAEASVVAEVAVHQSRPETWLRCGPRKLLGPEWQDSAAPTTNVRIEARQALILTEEQQRLVLKEWDDAGVVFPGEAISDGD